ncbi:hypothetical protein Hanom_Chr16g01453051 [Helianthus anomalus]
MSTLSEMKIVWKFPPHGKRFWGKHDQPLVPKQLPAQFDLVYPPAVLGDVPEPEPDMDIMDLPQLRGPPKVPEFPRHVRPCPSPRATTYQQLHHDVDKLTYVMEWLVEEAQEHRHREGLPPWPFHPPPVWHQYQQQQDEQQQDPPPYYFIFCYVFSI